MTVALSSSGAGTFYSDSGCANASSNFVVSSSTQAFYFKSGTTGSLNFTSNNNGGLTSGTFPVTVISSIATKLAISGVTAPAAGACTAYAVTSIDNYNNTANVAASTTVAISGSGSGAFYSDSSCVSPVTSITITANSQTFYFKDSVAENLTLIASYGGLTSGNLSISIEATVPSVLVLSGPLVPVVGSCTAYTLTTEDTYGNTSVVGALTTATISGRMFGNFYSDSSCSTTTNFVGITLGQSSRPFISKARYLRVSHSQLPLLTLLDRDT